jgi:hypothetical protein
MYIIVFDDGQLFKTNDLTEEDIDACNDGNIDIINPTDGTRFENDSWVPLKVWGEKSS